ncbi:MAG TPA: hypothetical protein VFN52_03715 [Acidiferrobacteraceae bacterium]|nr:hypothetical protein [Acidiferrobacteraceae bacterium]
MRAQHYQQPFPPRPLQVRGDPSVREFVFQQTRVESDFDRHVDPLLEVAARLLMESRVFHLIIHFSSNQLTCWPNSDPYRYRVHVGLEVLTAGFPERFRVASITPPVIPHAALKPILGEFRRLRFKDPNIYLRNGSINVINGIIGMSFSCDGSHYLPYEDFCQRIDTY